LIPPSRAIALAKPMSRSVAAAIVEIFPSSQVISTRTVGSGSTASTRSSIWPRAAEAHPARARYA